MLPLIAMLGATAVGAQQSFASPHDMRTPIPGFEPKPGEVLPLYKDWRAVLATTLLVGGSAMKGEAGAVAQFAGLGFATSVVSTELGRSQAMKVREAAQAQQLHQQALPSPGAYPGAYPGGLPHPGMQPYGQPGMYPGLGLRSPLLPTVGP